MADPPGVYPQSSISGRRWINIIQQGTRNYLDSFDAAKRLEQERKFYGDTFEERVDFSHERQEWSSVINELGAAAKKGGQSFIPVLQKIAAERVAAYQQALAQFVKGYREGQSWKQDGVAANGERPAEAKGEEERGSVNEAHRTETSRSTHV